MFYPKAIANAIADSNIFTPPTCTCPPFIVFTFPSTVTEPVIKTEPVICCILAVVEPISIV